MALSDFDEVAASAAALPVTRGTTWMSMLPAAAPAPAPVMPDAQGNYPWNRAYGVPASTAPATPPPQINLNSLFANKAPTPLFQSTRSQQVQGAVSDAFKTRANNQAMTDQSLTDFVNELKASRVPVKEFGNQEQSAISQVYDNGPGGIASQLAAINRQRQAATNMAAQSAMNRAGRANSSRRLTAGGSGSSYLDRLFAQDLRNVAVGAAGQGADQARADLQYVQGLRENNVGRRQSIIDSILNRNLAPAEAAGRFEAGNLANLGNLANIEYGNNVYAQPEDAYLKRLNFLEQLRAMGYA